jgi:hypothetical protein
MLAASICDHHLPREHLLIKLAENPKSNHVIEVVYSVHKISADRVAVPGQNFRT